MIRSSFRYQGFVYRGHNPKWSYSPVSGEGAARHGGRFNPKGVEALYTSESFETAWAEAQQGFAFKTQPLTVCTYAVDCTSIVDLTDPKVLAQTGFSSGDLRCAWELMVSDKKLPPSWTLASALIAQNISGVRVPSYAPGAPVGATNIVFWKYEACKPYQVVVIDDDDRLPKNTKSWE